MCEGSVPVEISAPGLFSESAFEAKGVLVHKDGPHGPYSEIISPDAFDPTQMEGLPVILNFGRVIGRVTRAVVTDLNGIEIKLEIDKGAPHE